MEADMGRTSEGQNELLMIPISTIFRSVSTVFTELINGTESGYGWVLNRGDKGLLRSLDQLSSREASMVPAEGGASIAAHVDHLCYGLSLFNRWNAGEQDPFTDADYSASWRKASVSANEWEALRSRLRKEARSWRDALTESRQLSEMEMIGIVACTAHVAYHLGAIRQMNRSTRGPTAND